MHRTALDSSGVLLSLEIGKPNTLQSDCWFGWGEQDILIIILRHGWSVGLLARFPTLRSRANNNMKKYEIDDMKFYSRNLPVNAREFVSWANVYLLSQVLIVMYAIQITATMPIQFLVMAIAAVWLISVINKI